MPATPPLRLTAVLNLARSGTQRASRTPRLDLEFDTYYVTISLSHNLSAGWHCMPSVVRLILLLVHGQLATVDDDNLEGVVGGTSRGESKDRGGGARVCGWCDPLIKGVYCTVFAKGRCDLLT